MRKILFTMTFVGQPVASVSARWWLLILPLRSVQRATRERCAAAAAD